MEELATGGAEDALYIVHSHVQLDALDPENSHQLWMLGPSSLSPRQLANPHAWIPLSSQCKHKWQRLADD